MPTEVLSIGYPIPMVQNQIYAVPAARCLLFCEVAAATLFQSNTLAFTVSIAVTLDANKQAEVSGGFIRCTSAGPVLVTLKKA